VAGRRRPAKSITLSPELMNKIETEAKSANVPISQVIESHLNDHYQGGLPLRLAHMESSLNELKAAVLPVVTKVAVLIQQLEQDEKHVGQNQTSLNPTLPIVTHDEMYGPITQAPLQESPEMVTEPPPRKRWTWRG
jgi:hypothetical protein